MDHKRITDLQTMLKELDAVVAGSTRGLTSVDLAEAAQELISDPFTGLLRCLSSRDFANSGAALMATSIIREAIRKAEVEEMEK